MTDIKPRWDEDGVPWCDDGCPQIRGFMTCDITGGIHKNQICPHAVKEMASKLSTMTDIKPRYDDDGVPWCDVGCPCYCDDDGEGFAQCEVEGGYFLGGVCPHAVKDMALENAGAKTISEMRARENAKLREENRALKKFITEMPAICAGLDVDAIDGAEEG